MSLISFLDPHFFTRILDGSSDGGAASSLYSFVSLFLLCRVTLIFDALLRSCVRVWVNYGKKGRGLLNSVGTLLKPPANGPGAVGGANCEFLTLGFPFDSRHNSKFKRGRTELLQGTLGLICGSGRTMT